MQKLFNYKLPAYLFLITLLLTGIVIYLMFYLNTSKENTLNETVVSQSLFSANPDIKRIGGYNFIAPLMFVDLPTKSTKYSNLASAITTLIEAKKQSMQLAEASFYILDLNNLEWGGVNEDTKFWPGSLMKVPILLSYLKIAEHNKGVLEKKLYYKEPYILALTPEILSKQIKPGNYYTIKELLNYMITFSDNNAAVLLDTNLDQRVFNKVLTDLGLTAPENGADNYPISAKEYSRFICSIYNASFLSKENSEYAAELLSKTDFKNGFSSGFPPSVKMIHKFGESGTAEEHQLSESGIIYLNNKTYAITIMTKGKNLQQLSSAIAEMAGIMYKFSSII